VHKQLRRLPLSILAKMQISVFPLARKKEGKMGTPDTRHT
jgi:hypothetical protein